MKPTSPLLRYYFPLLSCYFSLALASAQNDNTPPNNVLEAINICREKLEVDPHFPRIQHSLAQLLDSQISPSDNVDSALAYEVLQLYHDVGNPNPNVSEKRHPPAKVRFESLTRAGNIAKDVLHDTPQAIKYFSLAIKIDGVEESSLLVAFQTIMPTILSSINIDYQVEVTISPDGTLTSVTSDEHEQIQNVFDLCNMVEARCSTDPIVDEYRGAMLRRMKQPELAYQSYHQAMVKSKQNLNSEEYKSNQNSNEYVPLVADFVRTSILAAAAAREAGNDLQKQMSYLNDAEEVAVPLLVSINENQDMEEYSKDFFRDQMVDLYNNMGIAEKKQGSLNRARDVFKKALEINRNDGHALVQLASIDDGTSTDGVVSSVKELDPEYVSALFDGYSSRFESELVDVLQYQGHSLMCDALILALKQLGKSPLSVKKIVDLGCGTGLLGELVANEMPWVEVSGVDLSQRMIEISRERQSKRGKDVYASVSNEDAAKYLSTLEERSIDCILASDVVIYIGDISNLLEESSKCLVNDGLVGFTLESNQGTKTDSGFRLLPSGRFGHSRAYIDEVAKLNGFEVLSWKESVLRTQGGADVSGAVVVLRTQGGARR